MSLRERQTDRIHTDRDGRRGRKREGRKEGVREEKEYKASKVWELKPSTWEMEAAVLEFQASLGDSVSFKVRK